MGYRKILSVLALIVVLGFVGMTYAYFTSSTKLKNEFKIGTYSTSVKEEFISPDNWVPGTTTTKRINVTNHGTVKVVVRAMYIESWKAADGTTLSGVRNGENVAQFEVGSDWIKEGDYYYYNKVLGQNETSSDFISEVTFNPKFELVDGTDIECKNEVTETGQIASCTSLKSGYAGATYTLDVTVETIQADQAWNNIAQ